jgi:hypothetical protein
VLATSIWCYAHTFGVLVYALSFASILTASQFPEL